MIREIAGPLIALLLLSGTAEAQTCGALPNNLQNNTTADATQVMANFNALLGCINNLLTFPNTPQGRLTLTSNTPVMSGDVTAATTIYYTPYVGSFVPIYNGTQFLPTSFAQLSAATVAGNQQAGGVYDLFVFANSGAATLGFGPAWTSTTGRGTGAGTTQLQQLQGLWTNANIITLLNGTTTYANIPANQATYVGTVAITSTAGQMAMQFKPTPAAGGTNNWLGVWNTYNRVTVKTTCRDNTSTWAYNVATWRPSDGGSGNTNNRITWIDGLQQSRAAARFIELTVAASAQPTIGINFNSTTAAPVGVWGLNNSGTTEIYAEDQTVLFGLNYAQAMEENLNGTATASFYGTAGVPNAVVHQLLLELEM
jgi:hypothetical protein